MPKGPACEDQNKKRRADLVSRFYARRNPVWFEVDKTWTMEWAARGKRDRSEWNGDWCVAFALRFHSFVKTDARRDQNLAGG